MCVCMCVRERGGCEGGQTFGGCICGVACVCVWVEVLFAGQAIIIRDSLKVGSVSKIILALKN